MTQDTLNYSNFGLLPEPENRWGSFGVSAITNLILAAMLLLFAMASVHQQPQGKQLETTDLVFPSEPPRIQPIPRVKFLPQPRAQALLPRQVQKVELPKVEDVRLNTPILPSVPQAASKPVAPMPQPKVGLFVSATPTQRANNMSAPSLQVGRFGDPSGVRPNANASGRTQVPALGSLANAPGMGVGAGRAGRGSVQGVAFATGVTAGIPGRSGHETVATGSLGNSGIGRVQTTATVPQTASTFAPPEVVSEPAPQYTAEAKQSGIQGEVTLQVRFLATGQVQVLRVLRGLGHGLDEQATLAAQQIHFKPATRDGVPTDHTTLIHITFQLANAGVIRDGA